MSETVHVWTRFCSVLSFMVWSGSTVTHVKRVELGGIDASYDDVWRVL